MSWRRGSGPGYIGHHERGQLPNRRWNETPFTGSCIRGCTYCPWAPTTLISRERGTISRGARFLIHAHEISSMIELLSPNTGRRVVSRKAAVVTAVSSGVITIEDACHRYRMSGEEFFAWQRASRAMALSAYGLATFGKTGRHSPLPTGRLVNHPRRRRKLTARPGWIGSAVRHGAGASMKDFISLCELDHSRLASRHRELPCRDDRGQT